MKDLGSDAKKPVLKMLHLYPDVLCLYGDRGNIASVRYRTQSRGIDFSLTNATIGDRVNISDYDIVLIGGGPDREQAIASGDLLARKADFERAIESGTQFLLICGAYQLFGRYYIDAAGNEIKGMGIGDFCTESGGGKRCIGNILLETELEGEKIEIIGFENHGGQTRGVKTPFGRVIAGHGNYYVADPTSAEPLRHEGYFKDGVIGTYMHGPILPKNPRLTDYLIKKAVGATELAPLDDEIEIKAFETMRKRLI